MVNEPKHILLDMLQGNINRMCVTKDEDELARMHHWAVKRIDTLFKLRLDELSDYSFFETQ